MICRIVYKLLICFILGITHASQNGIPFLYRENFPKPDIQNLGRTIQTFQDTKSFSMLAKISACFDTNEQTPPPSPTKQTDGKRLIDFQRATNERLQQTYRAQTTKILTHILNKEYITPTLLMKIIQTSGYFHILKVLDSLDSNHQSMIAGIFACMQHNGFFMSSEDKRKTEELLKRHHMENAYALLANIPTLTSDEESTLRDIASYKKQIENFNASHDTIKLVVNDESVEKFDQWHFEYQTSLEEIDILKPLSLLIDTFNTEKLLSNIEKLFLTIATKTCLDGQLDTFKESVQCLQRTPKHCQTNSIKSVLQQIEGRAQSLKKDLQKQKVQDAIQESLEETQHKESTRTKSTELHKQSVANLNSMFEIISSEFSIKEGEIFGKCQFAVRDLSK